MLELFKTWKARFFIGGYLASTAVMTKKEALKFIEENIDGHDIVKVKGLNKGKVFKKFT